MFEKDSNIGKRPEMVKDLVMDNSVRDVRFTGANEVCVHLHTNASIGPRSSVTRTMDDEYDYHLDEVYPDPDHETALMVYYKK